MAGQEMIKIVQKMMEDGESDNKIISTLIELGLDRREAEKMLETGKQKSLSMQRSLISKLAKEQLELEKPELKKIIYQEAEKTRELLYDRISAKLLNELRQEKIKLEKSLQLANKVLENLEEKTEMQAKELGQVEKQIQKLQFSGFGEKNAWLKIVLIASGIIFSLSALALMFFSISSLEMETLILTAIIALTGITMFFGSSMV